MPAEPLSLPEREEIRTGIKRGEPLVAIALVLGRHRCTVSAEVARNGCRGGYRAVDAQARADAERARPKVPSLVASPGLAPHVERWLRAKVSPMTIAIELTAGVYPDVTGTVSHEAIYQSIPAHGTRGLPKGLHAGLHRGRRCRKHRLPNGTEPPVMTGPLGEFNLVTARPAVAANRSEVGHLEGDLIVGAFNRSAIVTLFDRASRHLWLTDLPEGHSADATLAALVELIERIPRHFAAH